MTRNAGSPKKKSAIIKTTSRSKPRNKTPPTKAKPLHKQRRRMGVSRAIALRNTKKLGPPQKRLKARLALEAKQELTPLSFDDKLLRLKEAAALLRISPHTLRDWALSNKCVYRRVGGVLLMIPESEVRRLSSIGN